MPLILYDFLLKIFPNCFDLYTLSFVCTPVDMLLSVIFATTPYCTLKIKFIYYSPNGFY